MRPLELGAIVMRHRRIASGALLVALTGCTAFDVPDDSQWYAARVVSVLAPSELDGSVNRRCVDGLSPAPERVAVVAVRLHRALHSTAFAVAPSTGVHVQDDVAVNFRLCQLRPGHG